MRHFRAPVCYRQFTALAGFFAIAAIGLSFRAKTVSHCRSFSVALGQKRVAKCATWRIPPVEHVVPAHYSLGECACAAR